MIEFEMAKKILKKNKLVVVIRSDSFDETVRIAENCISVGVKAVEITFTAPRPHRIIELLSEKYEETGVVIGAGTVLDSETARIAMLSGADFIVSPAVDKEMIKMCNRYGVLSIPGVFTPADIKLAKEYGAPMVKLFPASNINPKMISILNGPFPNTDFMVTGTMDEKLAKEWIDNGALTVGVGGAICGSAKTGDFETVKKKAKSFIDVLTKEEKNYAE